MREGKLTALKVARLTAPGRHGDGCGLWLQIAKGGSKSWILRYQRSKQAREMGLGSTVLVSLAEARVHAREARRLLFEGRDPIDERDVGRAAASIEVAQRTTFADAAERYVATHQSAWRSDKNRNHWRSTLSMYAFPVIGQLPVAAVDTGLVLKVLEPIWAKHPETAGRVRGRIEAILDWAKVRGYRDGENPARWRGHLDKLLPARGKFAQVRHHPAMPYVDLPDFMGELRSE